MEQLNFFNAAKKINYKEFCTLIKKWKQEEALVMQVYNSDENIEEIKSYTNFFMRKLEELEYVVIEKSFEERLIERAFKIYNKNFK